MINEFEVKLVMAASFKVACLGNCIKYVGIAVFVYMKKFAAGLKVWRMFTLKFSIF
jgi:hypothetical protein